jgi:hypothetical protein
MKEMDKSYIEEWLKEIIASYGAYGYEIITEIVPNKLTSVNKYILINL